MRKVLGRMVLCAAIVAVAACSSGGGSGGVSAGGSGVPTGGGGDFCGTLKNDVATFAKLGNTSSLDSKQLITVLQDLANKAPSEIKSDMQTLVDFYKKSIDLQSQISADPSKAASLGSDFASDSTKLQTATTNIEAFAKTKCGVDLNSGSSSSSST